MAICRGIFLAIIELVQGEFGDQILWPGSGVGELQVP